ncbi:MAG: DMT family transporter [Clostridium sp.]|nr:DMT family transporter [Clostridium sp.]
MTQKKAELLLAAVIVARATSFLFNKIGLATIGIFNILGIRYSLAFILLAVLFRDRLLHLKRDTVIRAALLSVSFFAIMTCELSSLKRTDPSTTAFLENTAVAFVPLFEAVLLRRLPSRISMAGTGLALCGVACLTLKNGFGGFGPGELFGIAAAMFYAGYIILTSRLSGKNDALELGILQNGFLGILGFACSFLFETPRLPAGSVEWGCVMGLVILCSAFGLTLQPVAQRYMPADRAGSFCALSPVASSMLTIIFLHEKVTVLSVLGAALILASIFVPNLAKRKKPLLQPKTKPAVPAPYPLLKAR